MAIKKDKDEEIKEKIFDEIKEYQQGLASTEESFTEDDLNAPVPKKTFFWQFFFIFSFLLLVIVGFFISQKIAPNLTLNSLAKLTINYKEKYQEPGYKLTINNKDYSNKVKITGKVNSNKLGKYTITYSYAKGFFKVKKRRTIYVKDLSKPVIILNGPRETYICPNSTYKEEGFKAIDNYDGDLTQKVTVTKKNGYYLYTVIDSSKNKTTLTRNIFNKDILKPSIILNNGNNITIVEGSNYFEEGYTATDNCDGNITSKVKVTGQVDTNTIGTYKLIYTVKDQENNEVSVTRTVNVVKKYANGSIYLTFDDGPRLGTTDKILDILRDENVKATFFVTNNGPDELIKREFDEGHSIGLHTATHNYSIVYSSVSSYFNDLKIVSDRVERITGTKSMIIRFPGGSSNTISKKYQKGIMTNLTKEVLARGYKYYDWNLSSGDAGITNTKEGVYEIVTKNLRRDRPNIILMHDIKSYTRDALKNIIDYAKQNGYSFEKIDNNTDIITQHVNN